MNDEENEDGQDDSDKPSVLYFGRDATNTDFSNFIQSMKVLIAAGYFNKSGESDEKAKNDEL